MGHCAEITDASRISGKTKYKVMEELILRPNEEYVLQPGERLEAVDQPLRIRFGYANEGTNSPKNIESILWETFKRSHGYPTAVYRRGTESLLISIVPESPQPDSFDFEGQPLTSTSRIFKTGKADLNGWLPKAGDTLTYNDKTYIVKKTGASNTFFQDVGNFGVMIRIIVTEYRS
jgi:hypothetical protein